MTYDDELDTLVITRLRDGVDSIEAHALPRTAVELGKRRRRARGVSAVVLVAAIAAATPVAENLAFDSHGTPTTPATAPTDQAAASSSYANMPCSGSWEVFLDLSRGGFPTIEDAVAARAGDAYEVTGVALNPQSGMTWASVKDPAGATGKYEMTEYQGRWHITGGSGCAAR